MKFYPFEKFEIETYKSSNEIKELLESNIEPVKLIDFHTKGKLFKGSINKNQFELTRNILYINLFLPQITGEILSEKNTSKISITMDLNSLGSIILFIWTFVVGLVGIILLKEAIINNENIIMTIIIPLFLILIIWALASYSFWDEVKEQKKILIDILKY